jgi:hypothetical protein
MQDHRTMSLHKHFKGALIMLERKSLEQVLVGLLLFWRRRGQLPQMGNDSL